MSEIGPEPFGSYFSVSLTIEGDTVRRHVVLYVAAMKGQGYSDSFNRYMNLSNDQARELGMALIAEAAHADATGVALADSYSEGGS